MKRQEDDIAELETGLLVQALDQQFGVDLSHFQRRRLSDKAIAFCKHHEIDSISSLQGRLLRDTELANSAIKFFLRHSPRGLARTGAWPALRDALLPMLRSSPWPTIWLPDCTSAQLVVQLAALLEEENLLSKTQLFVTHSCEAIISEMRGWRLPAANLALSKKTDRQGGEGHSLMQLYEPDDEAFQLTPALQSSIVLGQYDMLTGASMREFEAIVCAAPIHDFALHAQRNVVALFAESLCNFGVLQLDVDLTLHCAKPHGQFVALVPEYGLFRRAR